MKVNKFDLKSLEVSNSEIFDNYNEQNEEKLIRIKRNDKIDQIYGFDLYDDVKIRTGWLINMKTTDTIDENKRLISAMVYYFMEENGNRFKSIFRFYPYFCLVTKLNCENDVISFLRKKYPNHISKLEIIEKEDLDLDNHLIGLKKTLVKLSFYTIDDLVKVRKDLMPKIKNNQKILTETSEYNLLLAEHFQERNIEKNQSNVNKITSDILDNLIDIREYDVPYHIRVSIDMQIFVGKWYDVSGSGEYTKIISREDILEQPEPVVLAYDIETTKLPLKFPDATFDQIMMISYMIDGIGYLICNREIIADDIEDFEFTPRPEFPGIFTVFNEPNEKRTLEKFFEHIREVRPNIFVTYNGDSFDWPFVENRSSSHGLDMMDYIGFCKDSQNEYKSRGPIHMDCFKWVKRDSYLPVGAQGLKAVCKAKLRYDPVEVDPEDMCKLAREDPRTLANYSVSDAVATYYLYMKYVHPFIFALCTIIPMDPDEVLRKGSGTLCESLLMVKAFNINILFPNKQENKLNPLTSDGHVLESETYVGGHVEAIESGVFRADIPTKFRIVPEMSKFLRQNLRKTLKYVLEVEEKVVFEDITNFDEVYMEIDSKLENLQNTPNRFECPIIYHLDVAAMYPNIILSNRLQPSALVTEKTCSACDFNMPNAKCKRPMQWTWRGEIMPASRSEYYLIQSQLEKEKFPPKRPGEPMRSFFELDKVEQANAEKDRLEKYCRNAYKRRRDTRLEERTSVVCQKENSFYVDTVRAFRDRRYEFKDLTKVWKKKMDELVLNKGDAAEIKRANGMLVVYDSLQLAHKCILNSFYGYVMRKGARWYSMEMAGIVCLTGASIIKDAREIIEQIGRPLELDTDGIWCILPASFPENYSFKTKDKKKPKVTISYPGAMLNVMVQEKYANHQYHDLVDPINHIYNVRSENSIFFEVDGPYLAMILPASKEQGKKLKKRYAVFNFDGTLAELKGFEVKRNGELNLIKIFQSSVFEAFLKGTTLEEVYENVATVADYWLDLLYSRAQTIPDEELFELISEKRTMSRKLEDYGKQKSTSISTARRLAEFLGDEMVKDAGLCLKFIISKKPEGLQVTDRAIPVAVFQTEDSVKRFYLWKWLKSNDLQDLEIRNILDWDYYIERFSSNIQKIITIPAALQHIPNPVPRVTHPDWLHKKLMEKDDTFKQKRIDQMFQPITKEQSGIETFKKFEDIENCAVIIKKQSIILPCKGKRKLEDKTLDIDNLDMNNLPSSWREILTDPVGKGNSSRKELLVWLNFHKRKWEIQKLLRDKRVDKENVEPSFKKPRTVKQDRLIQGGLSSFIIRTKQSILEDTWEIIQIVDTTVPGTYRFWVLIGQDLHSMKVLVPRTFYVNARDVKETGSNFYYRRVHKLLPRSHVVYNIYEYNIEEPNFLKFESDILSEFTKDEVEGIYELQVPLLFRTLVKLGCMCSIDKSNLKAEKMTQFYQNSNVTFELNELKLRSISQHSYLSHDALKTLFIFHHKSVRNQIICLFNPVQNRAFFCIVEQSKSTYGKYLNGVQSFYVRERESVTDKKNLPSDMQFEIFGEQFEINAFKTINKLLLNYKTDTKIPTILVTATKVSQSNLSSNIPAMNEFPCVSILQTEPENSFNILDWQRVAFKSAVRAFIKYPLMFEEQLERAKYLHIPVGNMDNFQSDAQGISNSCDLFYARYLIKHEHILWCSPLSDPDLGGKETDDRRMMLVDNEGLRSSVIERNKPGCYPSVCVQLEMTYLPINSIISMNKISEIDGTNGRLFETTVAVSKTIDELMPLSDSTKANANLKNIVSIYDDTTAAGSSFRILRNMILSWLKDVREYKNLIADEHIVGFYKWMRSPSSLLYDPALYKTLQKLMRKVFFKLVEQLNNLGVEVVYGNLNKIILCTRRTDLLDALSHVEYATKTVRMQEIFSNLDFQYFSGWDYMIWKDPSNFCGIKADLNSISKDQLGEDFSFVDLTNSRQIFSCEMLTNDERFDMNWHLARYLSPVSSVQTRFMEILQYYIQMSWKVIKDEYKLIRLAQNITDSSDYDTRNTVVGSDASLYPTTIQRLEDFLKEDMAHRLYSFASQLKDVPRLGKEVTLNDNKDLAPLIPLKNHVIINPLVDLVKTICHILSMDSSTEYYIDDWKRNMCKIIEIDPFSEIAKWRCPYSRTVTSGPEVSGKEELLVVIAELICDNCNMSRDLDLCRDLYRIKIDSIWRYVCPGCESVYDQNSIETTLTEQLNCLIEASLLQDLRCNRCYKGILETSLAESRNCKACGNAITCTRDSELLKQQISVYRDIGNYCDMIYLTSVTEWILSGNNSNI